MTRVNVIEMYKEIVDELILLHQKHNTDDYINVSHVQEAALEILYYQIELDRLAQ